MTAETETTTFPLHPVAEETLAAMPEITARLTAAIDVPPYPVWLSWSLYDQCVPVTAQACAALVAGWVAEARARLHAAANDWLVGAPAPAAEPARFPESAGVPPAADPVAEPAENDGLRLTESGHEDPSAASEGDAADADLPRPGRADALGREEGTLAGPGQPDHTAVIPAVEAATEMFPAVTDGTEGSAS